ncbi:hypothetical protein B0H16DRAFT_1465359 [Mycena metata]|uniref:Uncharacterized protein n=1 Tax=Mycena metata TaxID=1033252 RepID=A0AAD7IBY3_9AGAR|nr:hypothetical protein B0H16DRAFT_1465359 [Mycena metata]
MATAKKGSLSRDAALAGVTIFGPRAKPEPVPPPPHPPAPTPAGPGPDTDTENRREYHFPGRMCCMHDMSIHLAYTRDDIQSRVRRAHVRRTRIHVVRYGEGIVETHSLPAHPPGHVRRGIRSTNHINGSSHFFDGDCAHVEFGSGGVQAQGAGRGKREAGSGSRKREGEPACGGKLLQEAERWVVAAKSCAQSNKAKGSPSVGEFQLSRIFIMLLCCTHPIGFMALDVLD